MKHMRDNGKERVLPEYSWDYCFPGDECGYKWTVLVGKERQSGGIMATAVPNKGGSGQFSVDKCVSFINEMGDRNCDIIIKSDQEPAAKSLLRAVVDKKLLECVDMERPEGKTVIEESPVQSSASNGIVERAIQEIEGRIRAIYLQLESRIGRDISAKERIIAFIPEYAAYLTNRLHKWSDGKTAYERTRGKKPTVLGIEFGEKLLYLLKLSHE